MLKTKPEHLSKDGRREFVVLSVEDFDKIKEALEDADDLRNLREAKRKNAKHPYFTLEETEQMLKQRGVTHLCGEGLGFGPSPGTLGEVG